MAGVYSHHTSSSLFCILCRISTVKHSKKVETHTNSAYGMVPVREDPVYDVVNV